jgi:hypothetical protein
VFASKPSLNMKNSAVTKPSDMLVIAPAVVARFQ